MLKVRKRKKSKTILRCVAWWNPRKDQDFITLTFPIVMNFIMKLYILGVLLIISLNLRDNFFIPHSLKRVSNLHVKFEIIVF